jgi:hypothetical protein
MWGVPVSTGQNHGQKYVRISECVCISMYVCKHLLVYVCMYGMVVVDQKCGGIVLEESLTSY